MHFLHVANSDKPVALFSLGVIISVGYRVKSTSGTHIPMYMSDWIKKLDDFIRLSGSELLENAGKVTHLEAITKALLEFEKYKEQTKSDLSGIELEQPGNEFLT